MRKFLKNIILSIIELIEKYEYRHLDLDENDITKKNKLDIEFKKLICKRELVYAGNKDIIETVISEAEGL